MLKRIAAKLKGWWNSFLRYINNPPVDHVISANFGATIGRIAFYATLATLALQTGNISNLAISLLIITLEITIQTHVINLLLNRSFYENVAGEILGETITIDI